MLAARSVHFGNPTGTPEPCKSSITAVSTSMQKRITSARQVETLRASDSRQELRDGEVKGLILRITPAGDKSWSVLYSRQPDGKKRRITIGPFPAFTLENGPQGGAGHSCRASRVAKIRPAKSKPSARSRSTL